MVTWTRGASRDEMPPSVLTPSGPVRPRALPRSRSRARRRNPPRLLRPPAPPLPPPSRAGTRLGLEDRLHREPRAVEDIAHEHDARRAVRDLVPRRRVRVRFRGLGHDLRDRLFDRGQRAREGALVGALQRGRVERPARAEAPERHAHLGVSPSLVLTPLSLSLMIRPEIGPDSAPQGNDVVGLLETCLSAEGAAASARGRWCSASSSSAG